MTAARPRPMSAGPWSIVARAARSCRACRLLRRADGRTVARTRRGGDDLAGRAALVDHRRLRIARSRARRRIDVAVAGLVEHGRADRRVAGLAAEQRLHRLTLAIDL